MRILSAIAHETGRTQGKEKQKSIYANTIIFFNTFGNLEADFSIILDKCLWTVIDNFEVKLHFN